MQDVNKTFRYLSHSGSCSSRSGSSRMLLGEPLGIVDSTHLKNKRFGRRRSMFARQRCRGLRRLGNCDHRRRAAARTCFGRSASRQRLVATVARPLSARHRPHDASSIWILQHTKTVGARLSPVAIACLRASSLVVVAAAAVERQFALSKPL